MTVRRESEQMYSSFYKSLKNFLYYSLGERIGGVARWGSRTTGSHRDRSDLDVIFLIILKNFGLFMKNHKTHTFCDLSEIIQISF